MRPRLNFGLLRRAAVIAGLAITFQSPALGAAFVAGYSTYRVGMFITRLMSG